MYKYTFYNEADNEKFKEACKKLLHGMDNLIANEPIIDVDGTIIQKYTTSHVNVNLRSVICTSILLGNFNTSHVNVNHFFDKTETVEKIHFNTSHVNVNRKPIEEYFNIDLFQYISC